MALRHTTLTRALFISAFAIFVGSSFGGDDEFKRYSSSIEVISLPTTFDCDREIQLANMAKVDSSLFEEFRPPMAHLVGRLFLKDTFVSIVYLLPTDNGTPILYTYTRGGHPIDTLGLYLGGCQADPQGSDHSVATILTDGTLMLVDTVFSVQLDSLEDPLSVSFDVHKACYHLNSNGQFKKITKP